MEDPCLSGSEWARQASRHIYYLQRVMAVPQPPEVTTIPPTGLSNSTSLSLGLAPH